MNQNNNNSMESVDKRIDSILDSTLEEFFGGHDYKGYWKAAVALRCNHIKTVRQLCYLTMKDLIVITGLQRTLLYDIQNALMEVGLDLGMSARMVAALRNGEEPNYSSDELRENKELLSFGMDSMLNFDDSIEGQEEAVEHRIVAMMSAIQRFEKDRNERLRYTGQL